MRREKLLDGRVALYHGDCLIALNKIAINSVDACVCDPPYHLSSITKRFGQANAAPAKIGKTGAYRRTSAGFMGKKWDGGDIAFDPATWAKVFRVLKPGGFIVAFSSSRTFGRMSVAIEDAGFITHPFIAWMFGSGFPKGHRVAASGLSELDRQTEGWDGWRYGTQTLKPAIEPIYVGQKPFEDGLNGWHNIQKWGVGALNVDGCRVPFADRADEMESKEKNRYADFGSGARNNSVYNSDLRARGDRGNYDPIGRWPANIVHDGSSEVLARFPDEGAGSAGRFFYSAKADSDDRIGSLHATVKPLDLMQWLVRLVCPPGGLLVDPFAGTGATGEAAFRERMRAILIEREAEYCVDIRRRMKLAMAGPDERARESIKAKLAARGDAVDHGPLFGGAE